MREQIMISIPTNCPSCNSVLVISNDLLYCRNTDCGATSQKRVLHFAKTLKIKGLGQSTIDKLNISRIEEIYTLDIAYMTVCLNSAKIAVKLFEEIEKSKKESFNTILPAFGISLIGETAADKLSKVCDSVFDIDEETCKAAGLGEKATNNLLNWIENDFERYCDLPFSFEFEKASQPTNIKGVICISGKLSSFKTKAEAAKILESLGYVIKDSMTKDVTILVNESGRETDKTIKARNSGVTIIENLKTFIGEY